ncbi:MAG: hypothetical protein OEY86_15100 [Nitrospira sp.]|nr:hypothetical protein [Nitrospira sp.]
MKAKIPQVLLPVFGWAVCAVGLVPAWAGEPVQAGNTTNNAVVVKKYPPYPDVWEWVTPFPSRMSHRFQADLLPDGEVQLAYQLKSKTPTPAEDIVPRGEKLSVLFFGKHAVPPPKDMYAHDHKWRVKLPNGKIAMSAGRSDTNSNCFVLFDRNFEVRSADEKVLNRKMLLYVSDRPETFVPSGTCEGEPYTDPPFSYHVTPMGAGLIPLEDNTFLVVDYEHGVVLRFDEQWQTQSSLLNRRVFVLNEQEVQAFIRNSKYQKTEAEGFGLRWQQVEDDLYRHLMTLKEGN